MTKALPESYGDLIANPGERAMAALHVADDARLHAAMLTVEIGKLEANRHAVKVEAVKRLMQPTEAEPKGLSRTAAEGVVNSDPSYNDYLQHLEAKRAKLTETQDEVRIALATARLATALIECQVTA